jgi:hypothetical protein
VDAEWKLVGRGIINGVMLVQVAEPAEITLKGNQEMDPIIRNPEGESVFQWMPIEPSFV